jgi:hypothetical protein
MTIFLSPHNKDETLWGSFTIMREKPLVVIVTSEEKREETKQAMEILGASVEFLGIKDTQLNESILTESLKKYNPDKVYAPKPNSFYEQHSLVGRVAEKLWGDKVIFYSTYEKDKNYLQGEIPIHPRLEERILKNKALDVYKSQLIRDPEHFLMMRKETEYLNRDKRKMTAVLLSWKRPKELEEIIAHLKTVPQIDEILICRNTGEKNLRSYGRYVMAKKAKNKIIYFQDDDCIIKNIAEMLVAFDGSCLVHGLKSTFFARYASRKKGPFITIVGWGAILSKDWINLTDNYLKEFPKDDLFLEMADRVWSTFLPKRNLAIPIDLKEFPSASGPEAQWKHPDYASKVRKITLRLEEFYPRWQALL